MKKRFRVCTLDQHFLLPPSLQDWLPEDHLARFVADVVNELDWSAIYAEYERKGGRGLSAYHPLLMSRNSPGTPPRTPLHRSLEYLKMAEPVNQFRRVLCFCYPVPECQSKMPILEKGQA